MREKNSGVVQLPRFHLTDLPVEQLWPKFTENLYPRRRRRGERTRRRIKGRRRRRGGRRRGGIAYCIYKKNKKQQQQLWKNMVHIINYSTTYNNELLRWAHFFKISFLWLRRSSGALKETIANFSSLHNLQFFSLIL